MNDIYLSRLKSFRLLDNLVQLKFSEMLGISPEHYSKVENGNKNPSLSLHMNMCLKLNKPSDCFFNGDRHGITMNEDIVENLKRLDTKKLKLILDIVQSIYESEREL